MSDPKPTSPPLNSKLRAALEYLGERHCTHRTSRYKPTANFLLDEWRARRHGLSLATPAEAPIDLETIRRRRAGGARIAEA